jgi:Tfp pilus assembly protein PilZ
MSSREIGVDRRSYERVAWDSQARLMQLGSETGDSVPGMHQVLGRNISEGGLQVWADRLFSVRSRLLVEMEVPGIPVGIQAVGSVVWVSPSSPDVRWILGIEFSDVGDTARARIQSLIRPVDR